MNQETITGSVNHEGLFTAKNPYTDATYIREEAINFHKFRDEHPKLLCYTPSNELVIDVENVEVAKGYMGLYGTIWQTITEHAYKHFLLNQTGYQMSKVMEVYITVPPTEKVRDLTIQDVLKVFLDLPQFDQIKIIRHIFADEIQTTGPFPHDYFMIFFSKYKSDYGTNVNPLLSTIEGCGFKLDRPQPTEKALTEAPKESEEKELYYCLSDNADLNGLYLASMREVSEHIEMDLGDIDPSDRGNVQYTITPSYLTQTEFDNLPEYEG